VLDALRAPLPVESLALGRSSERIRASVGAAEKPRVGAKELMRALVPPHLWREGGDFHERFWAWLDAIPEDEAPRPYLAVWFRGSGKSTCAEIAVVAMGANGLRNYVIYVSRVQERADDHVAAIGAMLESHVVAERWPALATRAVGKFGSPKAWRRSRLITAGGLIVDALGLDTAARGLKIEFLRPDGCVFDDIDQHTDTPLTIQKHLDTISRGILPALTARAAICVAQNLIHPDGVLARIMDGRADVMQNAIKDGPIPALEGLSEHDREIPLDGEGKRGEIRPVWPDGFDLEKAKHEWELIGETAFRREMQHDVYARENAMFAHVEWRRCAELPPLVDRQLWIDPAVGAGTEGSLCGFVVAGRGVDPESKKEKLYVEWAHEQRMSPEAALRLAWRECRGRDVRRVGVETDQGGETWRPLAVRIFRELDETVIEEARSAAAEAGEGFDEEAARPDPISFLAAKAGSTGQSKYERWLRLLAGYERGEVVHLEGRAAATLETALLRLPDMEPFDLPDTMFWAWWSILDSRRGGWRAR
jgi:hypothetical protein